MSSDVGLQEKDIHRFFIDSKSDPTVAVGNYKAAIVDHQIQAGLLQWHSNVALEVMEVAADNRRT